MVIFIYLFVVALLESSKQFSTQKRNFALLTMWVMTLFIGLRWETGTDWHAYKKLFEELELKWSFLTNVYHYDFGYVLFNAAVRLFTDSYTVFLLLNASITIYLLYRFVTKLSPYPNLSLLSFYPGFMIAQFMGSNRRMMAIVFSLWAFYYLYEGRKKKYFLLLLLAFLFHRSSIVCLALLFLPKRMLTIRRTLVLLIVCFAIGITQLPYRAVGWIGEWLSGMGINNTIVEKMIYYYRYFWLEQQITTSVGSVVIQTILAVGKRTIFLLFYFYIMSRHSIDKLTGYIFNIYIWGFAGYLLLAGTPIQIMTAYFAIMEIVLLGRMYSYGSARDKQLMLCFMFVYVIIQMVSALNVYPDLYMPYISCFSDLHRE